MGIFMLAGWNTLRFRLTPKPVSTTLPYLQRVEIGHPIPASTELLSSFIIFPMTFNFLRIFGFAGTGLVILTVFYPALVYQGKCGERYSLLNHFISELGEVGVSHAACIFNTGLFLGGLVLLPYIIGLGILFGSVLGWLGTAAGIIAVLSVAAVGVFPMNNLKPHAIAAMTYFRAGMVMVFFFGLAILFPAAEKTVVSPSANLLSLLAFLAYGAFLTLPRVKHEEQKPADLLDPEQTPKRPHVWALATLEWLVFFSTVAWLFGMIFFI
jgi:hypothetical membrane protein